MVKNTAKKITKVVLILILLLSLGINVYAASGSERVTIFFNNIKVILNGHELELRDSNGNTVEPFIIEGTTYLPVRAISEALDLPVEWDKSANSVVLGTKPDNYVTSLAESESETIIGYVNESKDVVYADTGSKSVDVFFNNIKVILNGHELELKDGNGNTVEPFILDGTTYLPVRAISEALDLSVEWDKSANNVVLGTKLDNYDTSLTESESDFVFDSSSGTITDYVGESKDVIIPSEINGVSVISIGDSAFECKNLTSVTIPSSVTSLGKYAFAVNGLTSIIIPSSVTSMGTGVFYSNLLTSVTIPNSITSIEDWAFRENNLTSVTIPSSVKSIGEEAFRFNLLSSITIPSSVTSIGLWAFNNNLMSDGEDFIFGRKKDGTIDDSYIVSYAGKSKDIVIPSTVISLEGYVFNSTLNSITIPSTVTSLNEGIFYLSSIKKVIIQGDSSRFGNMDAYLRKEECEVVYEDSTKPTPTPKDVKGDYSMI